MNTRELRRQRRAAERKASKLERKQQAAVASAPSFTGQSTTAAAPPANRGHLSLHDLSHQDDDFDLPESKPAPPAATPPAPERVARNRENAQHSTGPRSVAGKQASSRNSFKHGLASATLIIAGEDEAAFQDLLASLLQEHAPATPTETLLVEEIAKSHWLTNRAIRLQNSCFETETVDAKGLSLFLRYQTTHQRNFYKALAELRRLQKERRKTTANPAAGFVSQPERTAAAHAGFVSQDSTNEASAMEQRVKEWLMETPKAA